MDRNKRSARALAVHSCCTTHGPHQEEVMEFTTCYCPYPQCTHYGKRGFNAHLVRCGADRGIPRLLCTKCQGTFSVRQGTAYLGSIQNTCQNRSQATRGLNRTRKNNR